MQFRQGDVVARKSYKGDIYFKIVELYTNEQGEEVALLRGLDVRLLADSPISDLEALTPGQIRQYRHEFIKQNNECLQRIFARRSLNRFDSNQENEKKSEEAAFFEIPGRVLHIDGDPDYLNLCMNTYKQLNIEAFGYAVPESQQPGKVGYLLGEHLPDILVLTGHDSIIKEKSDLTSIDNYRNSKFFVQSVKEARRFERSKDELIIFAGACQSHYEALLQAGANYASSPQRILIHAFDPVFIVEKLAFSPICQMVPVNEVIANTISGQDGVGGIETKGRFRRGLPKSSY